MKHSKQLILPFKIFWRSGKTISILLMVLYLVISLIPSGLLVLNRMIFEKVSIDNFSYVFICFILICYLMLQVMSEILSYFQNLLISKAGHYIQIDLQKKIHSKMLNIRLLELEQTETKDLIQRVSGLIPGKSADAVFSFLDIVCSMVQIFTSIIILVDIHWVIPVILVVFTIPYIILYRKMCFDNYFNEINQGKRHRQNWYLIQMLFEKKYNKELKIYNCFDYLGNKEKKINKQLHQESYAIARKYSILGVLLDILKGVGKAICMIIAVLLIVKKNAPISAFTVLVQAMDAVQDSLMGIFSKVNTFDSLFLVFNDYEKFFELENEMVFKGKIMENENAVFIRMQDLVFSYPTKSNALSNINLEIKKGEKIAIVGKNGSGKTTLVNILLGFYQPSGGSVEIYGQSLTDVLGEFRKNTVYVMQDIPQYGLTIKDNIYLGNITEDSKLHQLLNIDTLIAKAPNGIDTFLGEENDDRYNISGGEWAKIGIVRNCQKSIPLLYILDEPTASLDPMVESKIIGSFDEITKDTTAVFISHRLGIISIADRIIVMDDGKIVEEGTHEKLMADRGMYYTMYTEQLTLYAGR